MKKRAKTLSSDGVATKTAKLIERQTARAAARGVAGEHGAAVEPLPGASHGSTGTRAARRYIDKHRRQVVKARGLVQAEQAYLDHISVESDSVSSAGGDSGDESETSMERKWRFLGEHVGVEHVVSDTSGSDEDGDSEETPAMQVALKRARKVFTDHNGMEYDNSESLCARRARNLGPDSEAATAGLYEPPGPMVYTLVREAFSRRDRRLSDPYIAATGTTATRA